MRKRCLDFYYRVYDFVATLIEHPILGSSFGAYLAAFIIALLGYSGLAALFILIGIVLVIVSRANWRGVI